MLSVRPGITDPASIAFSDQNDLLEGSNDPDGDYDTKIRPWKSRLALAYIDHRNFWIDIWLILLTLWGILSKAATRRALCNLLRRWRCNPQIIRIVAREEPLLAYPPPGA